MKSLILVAANLATPGSPAPPPAPPLPVIRFMEQTYKACVQVRLGERVGEYRDPKSAVLASMKACEERRMEIAGEYALQNPGTRRVQEYLNSVDKSVVADLLKLIREQDVLDHERAK